MSTLPAGAELDRLVAEKVMGWRPCRVAGKFQAECINMWGQPIVEVINVGLSFDCMEEVMFCPSTKIAHAWQVVEAMGGRGFWTTVDQRKDGTAVARFSHMQLEGGGANADTAPHAIALAALAAVGGGV